MKILIIEDDDLLRKGLFSALTNEGFSCELAETGLLAEKWAQHAEFDLIILDLGLPDLDGLTLLTKWRKAKIVTPILILTARDTVEDRVEGLDAGADDYLIKPFSLDELNARVRALIRRKQGIVENKIDFGELSVDLKNQSVWLVKKAIALSPKEFALLRCLILKSDHKVHKETLQNSLYTLENDPSSNALEVHIHSLRQKIGKNRIQTLRGFGYQLQIIDRNNDEKKYT